MVLVGCSTTARQTASLTHLHSPYRDAEAIKRTHRLQPGNSGHIEELRR